jgi:hypothetical protein
MCDGVQLSGTRVCWGQRFVTEAHTELSLLVVARPDCNDRASCGTIAQDPRSAAIRRRSSDR